MSAFTRPPAAVAACSARKLEPPPDTKTASLGRGGAPSAAAAAMTATAAPLLAAPWRRAARAATNVCGRGARWAGSARPAVEAGMVRCIARLMVRERRKKNEK